MKNSFTAIFFAHLTHLGDVLRVSTGETLLPLQHFPLHSGKLLIIIRRMLARVFSAAVNGIEAFPVEVEVNSGWGDSVMVIVGLPDAAVKESRDRVSTALSNSGFKNPMGKTTINLAPADVKKEGPSFDLPIAVGLIAASEQCHSERIEDFTMV